MERLECELDRDQIDRVILTSLKEERQSIFQNWAEALINKTWDTCETCPTLLLHTLGKGSEHRLKLSEWYSTVIVTYKKELETLEQLLANQSNPFQKEQLKLKKPELDEWKALQLHDRFFQVFKKEKLINE